LSAIRTDKGSWRSADIFWTKRGQFLAIFWT